MTANTNVHTCSYYCERPECIKRQRDELRDWMESALAQRPPSAPVGVEEMQRRLDREESDHGRAIDQRDAAEDALGRMFQAVTGRPAEWSSAWGYVDAIEEVEEHVAALAQQPAAMAPPPGDGCHCGTCTCNPNMTPAVRFDLSPAQMEGAIRDHLIALGWTPPNTAPPPSAPAGVDWPTIVEGLRLADHFFDGDDRYSPHARKVRAAYRAALAAQQQGGAE